MSTLPHRGSWEHDGFAQLPGIFPPTTVNYLRTACLQLFENENTGSLVFLKDNAAQWYEWVAQLIDRSPSLLSVITILGSYIHVLASEVWVRALGAPELAWHGDGGPLMLDISDTSQVKLQFFLTDCERDESANLVVVPGSHNRQLPENGMAETDLSRVVTVPPRAGDAILWSGDTWHAVRVNKQRQPRVSIIVAYGLMWPQPCDYVPVQGQFRKHASPLQSVLFRIAERHRFRRGTFYYPSADDPTVRLLSEKLGTLPPLPIRILRHTHLDRAAESKTI